MQDVNALHDALANWVSLRDRMLVTHPDMRRGKMMSADALIFGGKVFAFHSAKGGRVGLGCRIGREADPSQFELKDWQHLAPFKSKPPMKDWIVIGTGDVAQWRAVAEHCLNTFRNKEAPR